jgi:two-component system OmpR family response regulator
MRMLLVEDDAGLGGAVRDHVAAEGHRVDWASRLYEVSDYVRTVPYELVLLDLLLPDGRGIDFLRGRRATGDDMPVIVLTALDQISDRIAGLNAGADDYLVKPFELSELSARLKVVARRYFGSPILLIVLGNLGIDLGSRTGMRVGRPVPLTSRAWVLLEAHVSRLRKKVGGDIIETVRGIGYRLGRR